MNKRKSRLKTLFKGFFKVTPVEKIGKEKYAYELTELSPTGFPKRKYSGKWKIVRHENGYYTFQEVM